MNLPGHDRLPFAIFLCLFSPIVAKASGVPAYVIQPLAAPAGQSILFPHGINASGEVVGDGWPTTYVASVDSAQPLEVRDPNTYGLLDIQSSFRINDAGTVTGTATGPAGQVTFVRSATSTELVTASGVDSTNVQDMNDAGAIVGDYYNGSGDDPGTHAFLYADHTFTRLGSLNNMTGPNGPNFSLATAINDAGVVAGVAQASDGSYPAFVYRDGQFVSLGTPAGYSTALVRAINNAGTLVGEASDVPAGSHDPSSSAMFLYEAGQYTLIPSPGGRIMPLDINSSGDVVGIYHYADATHASVAFIYHDGILSDLSDVLDPSSGWTLSDAEGINDAGQIVVRGGYLGQGYTAVMTPVPEPVGSCGLLVFVAAGSRRRVRSGSRGVPGLCPCGVRGT